MSALTRQSDSPFSHRGWEAEVLQLLDEHHLVAWSEQPRLRIQFAAWLGRFVQLQPDTELCVLHGRWIDSLEAFCHQLERIIPGGRLERRVDGPGGVVALLRSRETAPPQPAIRHRYYIWHDADVLLRHDHRLFGRLVDALAGVAAEAEYASDDLLLIHRAAFIGGSVLERYASDPRGQFAAWCDDGRGEPFWQVVTGLPAPPFVRLQIDRLRD